MPRKARNLLRYWAVRKLGFIGAELFKKLGVSPPSVSISVKRGEKIAKAKQLELVEDYKNINLWVCQIFSGSFLWSIKSLNRSDHFAFLPIELSPLMAAKL